MLIEEELQGIALSIQQLRYCVEQALQVFVCGLVCQGFEAVENAH